MQSSKHFFHDKWGKLTLQNQWKTHVPTLGAMISDVRKIVEAEYLRRCDVLPVEAQTEQTQALVGVCTTKDISENILQTGRGVLRGKTEHASSIEEGENVARNDFVAEHDSESSPEELDASVIPVCVEVQSCRTMETSVGRSVAQIWMKIP